MESRNQVLVLQISTHTGRQKDHMGPDSHSLLTLHSHIKRDLPNKPAKTPQNYILHHRPTGYSIQPIRNMHTVFLVPYGIFSKTDHVIDPKTSLNRCPKATTTIKKPNLTKKPEITPPILAGHSKQN